MQFGESGDIEGGNKKYWAALAAEFLGMMLFALYGGEARNQAAAYGNGLTLAVSWKLHCARCLASVTELCVQGCLRSRGSQWV